MPSRFLCSDGFSRGLKSETAEMPQASGTVAKQNRDTMKDRWLQKEPVSLCRRIQAVEGW
jgi:hypothetical protein